jgi:adenylate kinase family enzyme
MIIGGPGSGKSTLARVLAEKPGLPVTDIDQLQFRFGWIVINPAKRHAQVRDVTAREHWIIAGNNSSTAEERTSRANTVIWLNLSLCHRLWRVAGRTLKDYGQSSPDLRASCPKRLLVGFILYILSSKKQQRATAADRYTAISQKAQAFHLRTPRGVEKLLKQLS